MKIASWNVNSIRVRLEHTIEWMQKNQPDLFCLQELKVPDDDFPVAAFSAIGYHSYFTGQKSYNGVAILSKQPLENVETNLPDFEDPQRRFIKADYQGITLVNVYVPNGQALDSDKFVYKRAWFAKLQLAMRNYLAQNSKVVLVGDFNITPSDLDVHDPAKWRGKIHCSPIERLMLQNLMSEGLFDTYRSFHQQPDQFSWWDYRTDGYSRNEGLRIDLILSSSDILDVAKDCVIDESPRKLERPSDHTPVVVQYNC
ncbi:MAG: exodeoxyribonuclease-3 [Arenicella sp.]|jgi:exodeoxyribonuclease-3